MQYNATVHCCWKQNSLINNMGNDFCWLVVKLFRCNFVYVVVLLDFWTNDFMVGSFHQMWGYQMINWFYTMVCLNTWFRLAGWLAGWLAGRYALKLFNAQVVPSQFNHHSILMRCFNWCAQTHTHHSHTNTHTHTPRERERERNRRWCCTHTETCQCCPVTFSYKTA